MAENYQYFPQYLDEWSFYNDYGLLFHNTTNPYWPKSNSVWKYLIHIYTWYFWAVHNGKFLIIPLQNEQKTSWINTNKKQKRKESDYQFSYGITLFYDLKVGR